MQNRGAVAGVWPRALRVGVRGETGPVAAVAVFVLFALNFGAYRVFGDGVEYFSFVQRLFGDRPDGSGYNFGVGLLNAPFYAAAKVAATAAGVSTDRATEASVTLAAIAYVVLAAAVCAWLLGRLELPARGLVLAAALFGTPLWYYASFSPSYAHAADAAVTSAAAAALFFSLRSDRIAWTIAVGAALGLATAVRPFNAGLVAGAVVALVALRRARQAAVVAGASAAAFGLLVTIPLALGTGLRTRVTGEIVAAGVLEPAPLSPVRMLFTLHRGLYVWTPVTLLATVGLVLLVRSRRPGWDSVLVLAAMAAGLLVMHSGLSWWDGGWSFSARHFAGLLPAYAIGLGGLLASVTGRSRTLVVALGTVATVWSVFLGMSHAFGASQEDGADEIAGMYLSGERTPGEFVDLAWSYSRVRHLVERAP